MSSRNKDVIPIRAIKQYHSRGIKFAKMERSDSKVDAISREQYYLIVNGGDLHSRTALLNGKAQAVDTYIETIPQLKPGRIRLSDLTTVTSFSIMLMRIADMTVPACK